MIFEKFQNKLHVRKLHHAQQLVFLHMCMHNSIDDMYCQFIQIMVPQKLKKSTSMKFSFLFDSFYQGIHSSTFTFHIFCLYLQKMRSVFEVGYKHHGLQG